MKLRVIAIIGSACAALFAACVDPPAPGRTPRPTAARIEARAERQPGSAPQLHPGDDPTAARVRTWLREQAGTNAYIDGPIVRTPENDTAQVACVRISPAGAPDALRASRVVCVAGTEVLAGEDGFQRYLRMHEFDPVLAQPAVHVLLNLRDRMLGFTGRTYTEVHGRVEADVLVIDASGNTRTNATALPVPRRWRVTIARDGTTREQLIEPDSDAGSGAVVR